MDSEKALRWLAGLIALCALWFFLEGTRVPFGIDRLFR